jgi:hypothetical protein
MAVRDYLQPLLKYGSLSKINAYVINSDGSSDPSLIDGLRGELLRTLQRVTELRKQNETYFNLIPNLFLGFFIPQELSPQLRNELIEALQGLARDFPLSDVDPIDLEPIGEDVHFISLAGRSYRLESLVQWIQVRGDFILPDVRLPMFSPEIVELKRLCLENKLSLQPRRPISVSFQTALAGANLSVDDLSSLVVPQLRENHINVLGMLKNEWGLSLEKAIDEIQGLNYEQADALLLLYSKGLKGSHLRGLAINPSEYGPHHTVVLIMLIDEWGYSVENAVDAISGCDFETIQSFYSMSKPTYQP